MEELEAAAGRVIRSGRYINGSEVKSFEESLAKAAGVRFCVAVSTGLDALRLILKAYMELGRLKKGDEVIVPANTFIATFLAVTDCGLVAVAADVNETDFCLDLGALPISQRTRAVIPVHLYGNLCWDNAVMEKLREKGILIIEDAAQAIGVAGHLGDAAALSFYPAKNIGALGDAGACLTNDASLAETIRKLANYGSSEKYNHELCGLNCRMDELQAAFLSLKLRHLNEITRRRYEVARRYDRAITNPEVIKPEILSHCHQAWHQYVIRHPRRDELREYLSQRDINTEIHYPVACHKQPCYNGHQLLRKYSPLPVAEALVAEVLSLPIADVTDDDIDIISRNINSFS